uniref:Uncharacterized protein n=1 Tax=Rhizophora mucronata TaxID=61149 RepID=A0A2P2QH53_RHIMU
MSACTYAFSSFCLYSSVII